MGKVCIILDKIR